MKVKLSIYKSESGELSVGVFCKRKVLAIFDLSQDEL